MRAKGPQMTAKVKFVCEYCSGMNEAREVDLGHSLDCGHCARELHLPESASSPGFILDDFLILDEIAEGGAGTVYRAHQISLDRTVALKVLQNLQGMEAVGLLLSEARTAARLNHSNIVQAYAAGFCNGVCYFVMEFVEGHNLAELLQEFGPLNEMQVLKIAEKVCKALAFSWEREKLIHRDIKPENIMIADTDGEVKLMDMGLTCTAQEMQNEGDVVKGTVQYISPEQIRGANVDVRSDFYSLGASMFHMLTGKFLFQTLDQVQMMNHHLNSLAEFPYGTEVHPEVQELVLKLVAKDPIERFQSTGELLGAILLLEQQLVMGQSDFGHLSSADTLGSAVRKMKPVKSEKAQKDFAGTGKKPLVKEASSSRADSMRNKAAAKRRAKERKEKRNTQQDQKGQRPQASSAARAKSKKRKLPAAPPPPPPEPVKPAKNWTRIILLAMLFFEIGFMLMLEYWTNDDFKLRVDKLFEAKPVAEKPIKDKSP